MKKPHSILLCLIIILSIEPLYGIKKVIIDSATTDLKLSSIAKKVTSVNIDAEIPNKQNIIIDDKHVFIATYNEIWQYTFDGVFVNKISCPGFITYNIAADIVNKKLYVPMDNEVFCYDYYGNVISKVKLKNRSMACFFYKNKLWIQAYSFEEQKVHYNLSYLDFTTGKEFSIPHNTTINTQSNAIGCFSAYKNKLYSCVSTDSVIYQIEALKSTPFLYWHVNEAAKKTDKNKEVILKKGIIGKFLFINYNRKNTSRKEYETYLYLQHLETGKRYNISIERDFSKVINGIIDDIFNTEFCTIEHPLNKDGYFYYIISNRDNSKGCTILIAKMKE